MTWLLAMPALAQASVQETGQPGPSTDIVVTAPGKVFRIELRHLRRGQAAFLRDRDRYAPHSTLHFRLSARNGSLEGFALNATDGHTSVPVALSADGDIQLPDVRGDDWTLIGNRSRTGLRLRVLVLSPGTTETDKRLGDLRLQCRAGWAVMKMNVSILMRGGFEAAGGCGSSHFAIYEGNGQPLAAARVDEHGRAAPLPLSADGRAYRMPLADKALSDEARVHLSYR